MKRVLLHLQALALFLPCLLVLSDGHFLVNVLGVVYVAVLYRLSSTRKGKKFFLRYYHEILRLENMM